MEQWQEKPVFLRALELEGQERERYLQTACPDPATRERIDSLLRHHAHKASAPAEKEARPQTIEEFAILERIGEGGMGVVYLAEDTVLGRRVALKVLARHLTGSEDALARFRTEARSAAALAHPAIVPIFKFGFDGTHHYIVSEFVDGPTLADLIDLERARRRSNTPVDRAAWTRWSSEAISTIADALECSHRSSIVHRDVKPSNILVDPERGPRLTDFGIAKHITEEARTQSELVVGSCHYMSPEQASIAASTVDQRSDIFSLGVVMYELLALARPFEGADVRQVLRAVLLRDPARLRSMDPSIPKDLETICHKAIEKDPDRRYQTAAHMAADLRCYLAGRPILARPPGPWRKLRTAVARHRRTVTGIVAALLLTSIAAMAWRMDRQQRSLKEQALARMGQLSITVADTTEPATVFALPLDPSTRQFGPPTRIGPTPLRNHHHDPGPYRFVVLGPDGSFAEFDDHLMAGTSITRTVWLGARPAPDEPMAMFAPAEHRVTYLNPRDAIPVTSTPPLPAFMIDLAEVSNRDYLRFVQETGHPAPECWGADAPDPSIADLPVVAIARDDMQAYALWAGKRLPTLDEWMAAAQTPDGRSLPWGTQAAPEHLVPTREMLAACVANRAAPQLELYRRYTRAVRSAPPQTPTGLHFVFGNVAELTGTVVSSANGLTAVVAGTDWTYDPAFAGLDMVALFPASKGSPRIGFRCARSIAPTTTTKEITNVPPD